MKKLTIAIKKYIDNYPLERDIAIKYLDFLENFKEKWFYRENLDWHFTWSVMVFNKDLSKTLLMHHKKLDRWLNFWWHADGDTDLENVAIRELGEEAGIKVEKKDLLNDFIDLDLQTIPERKKEPEHFHYDIRYVVLLPDDIVFEKQDSEVNDIKWFDTKDLETWLSDWVLKVYNKLKNV